VFPVFHPFSKSNEKRLYFSVKKDKIKTNNPSTMKLSDYSRTKIDKNEPMEAEVSRDISQNN
jgi:hypothetical protein